MPVSDALRAALRASSESRYAIAQATGIDQGRLSRFLHGKVGLSLAAVDVLAAHLGLELRPVQRTRKARK